MADITICSKNRSKLLCNCYKIPGLVDPIVDTLNISYLADRYILGEQLGWGQFGVIRGATDMVTGETMACKSIAKDRLVSADDVKSVKLEIEVMALLSGHPNVVQLNAVYEEEGFVHLVMELCAGGELFHRLEKQGAFAEHSAGILFKHLMEVVVFCHDHGVVHRDLKPENILLANGGVDSPIKVADFGLATYVRPGESLYGTVGSPFYIAPEVLAGGYNAAADVWSAGVILYILLSGMPPFGGKTKSRIFEAVRSAELRFPPDQWNGVSQSAKELIARMLCRDPAQRLTARQVLEHSWIKDFACQPQGPYQHRSIVDFRQQQDSLSCSFSTQLIPTSRDVSFGFDLDNSCHDQPDPLSPTFTCLPSFSTSHVDILSPAPTIGFSFQSSFESDGIGDVRAIPLMPTFSFFSPSSSLEEVDYTPADGVDYTPVFRTDSSKANSVQTDNSMSELFATREFSSACLGRGIRELELKEIELRRGLAATSTSRAISSTRSKRNKTIGLGELEQLDLIVSESVIRWASCTCLPSAPSLRSSLVC